MTVKACITVTVVNCNMMCIYYVYVCMCACMFHYVHVKVMNALGDFLSHNRKHTQTNIPKLYTCTQWGSWQAEARVRGHAARHAFLVQRAIPWGVEPETRRRKGKSADHWASTTGFIPTTGIIRCLQGCGTVGWYIEISPSTPMISEDIWHTPTA